MRRPDFFPVARRSFLSRLGAGLAAVGAAVGIDSSTATAQGSSAGRWQAARHGEDDWFDKVPGKHRTILDAVSTKGVGDALHFASNIITTSKSGYGLESADLAIVISLRHGATAFAFNDAMWVKYSAPLSARTKVTDPKGEGPAVVNVFNASGYGGLLTNGATTIDSLIKLGVHFAVCNQSTLGISGNLARVTDGKPETTHKELTSNLIGNAHMVPSGIVAVGHAQERSYAYVYTG